MDQGSRKRRTPPTMVIIMSRLVHTAGPAEMRVRGGVTKKERFRSQTCGSSVAVGVGVVPLVSSILEAVSLARSTCAPLI